MSPEIEAFLKAHGVTFKVHRHSPLISFAEAKAALTFDETAMVKGLAFKPANGTWCHHRHAGRHACRL